MCQWRQVPRPTFKSVGEPDQTQSCQNDSSRRIKLCCGNTRWIFAATLATCTLRQNRLQQRWLSASLSVSIRIGGTHIIIIKQNSNHTNHIIKADQSDQSHWDQIKIPHCRPCRTSKFYCYRCQLLGLSLDMHLPGIPCHPFSQTALLGAGVQNQMVLFWDGVCAYLIIVTGTTGGARVNPVPVPV